MQNPEVITLVVVCDDHYMVLLAAMLKSIEQHHTTGEHLKVYVVEDRVAEVNKQKLQSSVDSLRTTLQWVKMAEAIPQDTSLPLDQSSWPLNIYIRLFIPYFIDADVQRVIYLDVDLIVQRDISILWHTDLGSKVVGAVVDHRVLRFDNSWGGGVPNYEQLGLSGDARYFNTGVLVIDVTRWRQMDVAGRVIKCIHENKSYANFPDQYGLNVVLAGHWKELDVLWNHFTTNPYHPDPFIIHYIATKPIYSSYDRDKRYKELFYKYLKLTAWKDFRELSGYKVYVKKLYNLLKKGALLRKVQVRLKNMLN